MAAAAPGITFELKAKRKEERRGPAVSLSFNQENKHFPGELLADFCVGLMGKL